MKRKRVHQSRHGEMAKPRVPKVRMPVPGTAPGIEHETLTERPASGPFRVTCTDFSPEQCQIREIEDLPGFLAHHRPAWSKVRWIHVEGLGSSVAIRALAEKYQIHPLAVEDVLHNVQRPKAEDYPGSGELPGRLFAVSRALSVDQGELRGEQMSFFLGRATLLSFEEWPGHLLPRIRSRLETSGSRLRENDASFLFYSLVDAIVDGYFPVLEECSDHLEDLEEEMLARPDRQTWGDVHVTKRELLLMRRTVWPMREMIGQLLREKHVSLSETTRTYFRDVYDHCVQALDLVETYREIAGGLTETYMTAISNRLNEIMKVLTVISTIFIPLSFLAGVYGMNMPIPENHWPGMYPLFWTVCLAVGGGMLLWLRRRQWI